MKEAIAIYIEDQANWRLQKAADHPEDFRNRHAADGLNALAAYVRSLPADDGRLQELYSLWGRDGLFSPHSGTSRAISRFRFSTPDEDCSAFLDRLVKIATADAIDLARDAGLIE